MCDPVVCSLHHTQQSQSDATMRQSETITTFKQMVSPLSIQGIRKVK